MCFINLMNLPLFFESRLSSWPLKAKTGTASHRAHYERSWATIDYSLFILMFVSQLACQYVVNNSLDPHNISQQFYVGNLDLSPHDQLKDNSFHHSYFPIIRTFYSECIRSRTTCWFLTKNVARRTINCILWRWVFQNSNVIQTMKLETMMMIIWEFEWVLYIFRLI